MIREMRFSPPPLIHKDCLDLKKWPEWEVFTFTHGQIWSLWVYYKQKRNKSTFVDAWCIWLLAGYLVRIRAIQIRLKLKAINLHENIQDKIISAWTGLKAVMHTGSTTDKTNHELGWCPIRPSSLAFSYTSFPSQNFTVFLLTGFT